MIRRHSLPAEVYALVEQTPATVLLGRRKPAIPPNRMQKPWTQLFIGAIARVRGAHSRPRFPRSLRESKAPLPPATVRSGILQLRMRNLL